MATLDDYETQINAKLRELHVWMTSNRTQESPEPPRKKPKPTAHPKLETREHQRVKVRAVHVKPFPRQQLRIPVNDVS